MLARMQRTESLMHCWWECKMIESLWKNIWQFPTKLTYTYHMTVALLEIYSTKRKMVFLQQPVLEYL